MVRGRVVDLVRRVRRGVRRAPFPRPTLRGWAVLGVGVVLVVGGLAATTSVAVSAGLLLVAIVVLGGVVVLAGAAPLRATRRAARTVIEAGEVYRETVEVTGRTVGLLPVSRVLVRERLDDHFATFADHDTLVDVGPGLPPARIEIEAIAARRGRPKVGPVTVRVEDPFGLLRIDRAVVPAEEVVVVPRSTSLAAIDTGALAGAVSAEAGRVGQGGSADDSELRPYRPGDPMRRVHWAQSARRGELHVRQTTQAQPPEALVVLDVQRTAYQQLGRDAFAELSDMGGDAAFEHAVEVAASVARVLAARTSRVALATAADDAVAAGDLTDVLVGLADVRVRSNARAVTEVLPDIPQRNAHGMTAVVTGRCTPEQAADLVSRTRGTTRGLFVTIVPPDAATRGILDRSGWRILVVPVSGGPRD